jgi:DNA-binding NtrC family response regulator
MNRLNVVIASRDTSVASHLAESLNRHFHSIALARSVDEIRQAIPRHRAQVAIVDLETANLDQVKDLCAEFSHTQVLCTHRIPDEEMWAESLAAGAIDCLHNADVAGIMDAVRRNVLMAKSKAA